MQFNVCKTSRVRQFGRAFWEFEGVKSKGEEVQAYYKEK